MQTTIQHFRIYRYEFPRQRPIGDSQVIATMHYIGVLELECDSGERGLGFFGALFHPLPSVEEMERIFSQQVFPAIQGQSPFVLTNRLSRPRGGNIQANPFGAAVDHAIWDLQGKLFNMPLYRLLGGTDNKVRAYASGLDYHLSQEEMQTFFQSAAKQGFNAFKIKVGHPDLNWDLQRLEGLVNAVGTNALIMVDANEAWSPKEAIRRLHAYHEAGFKIYWVEDPCLRDDYEGLNRIREAVPFTHLNSGEYLDLHGKRLLMEHKAVDILNIHGSISDNRHAAWLASEYGIPVSLGNTPFELGVHSAASMPEPTWLEYSFQDYNQLIADPIEFIDGYAIAPDRPGHGLELSEFAMANG